MTGRLAVALLVGPMLLAPGRPAGAVQAETPRGADASDARILVMPFDNVKREGRIIWLGEASAVLLTDDVNALGGDAITRPERQRAFDRLQVPPTATLTDATVIRIGQIVGAAAIVIGTLEMDGDTLVVRAREIALDTGRVQVDVTERGALADLFPTFERIARTIVPDARKTSEELRREQPPVAVFEDFVKGLLAETPSTAIRYLSAALGQLPTFDRARLAMWDVYTDEGEHERALAAVEPVPDASPVARRARFLKGLSEISLKLYDEAFATFKALADAEAAPAVLNNIGVVQLRRGATSQAGDASYYFNKAAQADPGDPDYLFNLGYADWLKRDTQAAIYWLREAVRRNPADGDAHFVLGAALAAAGDGVEASRERELARRLSSTYGADAARPAGDAVPPGLERIKHDVELPHARRIETTMATSEQRDQTALAAFYLDSARRLFEQERDRQAADELNRALYLSPYLAEAHLLLGRIHLRAGRVQEAIDAFKISLWSADTAAAHAALGEAYRQAKNVDAARAEAERALKLDPKSAEAKTLLERLDRP